MTRFQRPTCPRCTTGAFSGCRVLGAVCLMVLPALVVRRGGFEPTCVFAFNSVALNSMLVAPTHITAACTTDRAHVQALSGNRLMALAMALQRLQSWTKPHAVDKPAASHILLAAGTSQKLQVGVWDDMPCFAAGSWLLPPLLTNLPCQYCFRSAIYFCCRKSHGWCRSHI